MTAPGQRSARRRWGQLIGFGLVTIGLTHWPDVEDFMPEVELFPHADKVVHVAIYLGLTVLLWRAFAFGRVTIRGSTIGLMIVGVAAYGALDEITQAAVNRTPSVGDWAADVLGILAGSLAYFAQRRTSPASAT